MIKKYLISIYLFVGFLFASSDKVISINLENQMLYAKENGNVLFQGEISSGKDGYITPSGIFHILQKEKEHISNIYPKPNGGAKMPYMLRLTWDGIAIHQGYVTGRPISHGCIRVRKWLAKRLFMWAKKGTKVKISEDFWYTDQGVEYEPNQPSDYEDYGYINIKNY